jgi:hypothetical protein
MEKARYRPHHIFCVRFMKGEFPDRGEEFRQASQKTKDILERQLDAMVEVVEGVDQLCQFCPDCQNERCQNPQGGEDAVRKWDGAILKGLGIDYGETKTSSDWFMLIKEKAPLGFCEKRCPWKSSCAVFELS